MDTQSRDRPAVPVAPHGVPVRRPSHQSRLIFAPLGWLGSVSRWVFMFLLFVYLITLAMALFEIDGFQTLVSQLGGSSLDRGNVAGNTRQREILQAVRSTPRSPPPDLREAPRQALYEQIAAHLDPLRVATQALAEIGDQAELAVRTDDTYRRAQQGLFRETVTRIGSTVGDLQGQLGAICTAGAAGNAAGTGAAAGWTPDPSGTRPAEPSRCGLAALSGPVLALDQGLADLRALVPDAQTGGAPAGLDAQARAAHLIQELQDAAQTLSQATAALRPDRLLADSLSPLAAKVGALKNLDEDQVFRLVLDSYPAIRQTPATDPAPPAGAETAAPDRGRPRDVTAEIGQIDAALDGLQRVVVGTDQGLRQLGQVTALLAKIEVASRRLADLEVKVRVDSQGRPEDIRPKYQQALLDLNGAIAGIRKGLGDSTGVIAIADAIGDADPLAYRKATTILREYQALGRYQDILTPLSALGAWPLRCDESHWTPCRLERLPAALWNLVYRIGFNAQDMATMTRQALDMMVVLTMGAIGSLIYLVRKELDHLLLFSAGEVPSVRRSFHWYVFRPIFGMVVAVALYLLYKTGQVALGGGSDNVLAANVNLPILSILSLFAGLLSTQTLEMVEQKGRAWLAPQRRENLWASGLSQALRGAGKSVGDCAGQVGVTPEQVERWIGGQDKVTPEMQDRILTWLGRDRAELFGDANPRDHDAGTLAWAFGLKAALETHGSGIDVPQLALLVECDTQTVQDWVDLKRQVDRPMQLLIAGRLGTSVGELFTPQPPLAPGRPPAAWWATAGLRQAVHEHPRLRNLGLLAAELQVGAPTLYDLVEQLAPAPPDLRAGIVRLLGPTSPQGAALFTTQAPDWGQFRWAPGLRAALTQAALTAAELAAALDLDLERVHAWMELDGRASSTPWARDQVKRGQLSPATCDAVVAALGGGSEPKDLFAATRPESGARYAVRPTFRMAVDHCDGALSGFAAQVDAEPDQVERWAEQREPVAAATQARILDVLGLTDEHAAQLFTDVPQEDDAVG